LQREEGVRTPGGGRASAWVTLHELWAEITVPTGRTQPVADRLQANIEAEILVRHRADIATGMRLIRKTTGETYLIEARLPDNQLDLLRLLCSSVTNP
jgi:SPP1 family predicted phage head-tail adaptor